MLSIGAPLPASASEGLRFLPTSAAPDLCHTGLFRRLRERSYVKSQANRPTA